MERHDNCSLRWKDGCRRDMTIVVLGGKMGVGKT